RVLLRQPLVQGVVRLRATPPIRGVHDVVLAVTGHEVAVEALRTVEGVLVEIAGGVGVVIAGHDGLQTECTAAHAHRRAPTVPAASGVRIPVREFNSDTTRRPSRGIRIAAIGTAGNNVGASPVVTL